MEDKTSLIKLLGLPDTFGVVLLTFSFVLFLSPYFSGKDFGLFKIPQFADPARKRLKIIGPIVFLASFILFLPVISRTGIPVKNGNDAFDKRYPSSDIRSNSNNLTTPTDNHSEVQRHLERARDLYARAQYADAIKECDNALQLEPENQDALRLKASINETKKILNRNQ